METMFHFTSDNNHSQHQYVLPNITYFWQEIE